MCGGAEFCLHPWWTLAVLSVFMLVFLSLTAWMWKHRSRRRHHVIIRACVCIGQLAQMVSFARTSGPLVAIISESITKGIIFVALFGWSRNAATVAFTTTRLGSEAPSWLPRYTAALQIFSIIAYPLLATVEIVVDSRDACVVVSMTSDVLIIIMVYGVGLPVFVSNYKIRKVINNHRNDLTAAGASNKDVERDNQLKKPVRMLLLQSVVMAVLIGVITIIFISSLSRGSGEDSDAPTLAVACANGDEVLSVTLFNLWQLLLLWHSNVQRAGPSVKSTSQNSRVPPYSKDKLSSTQRDESSSTRHATTNGKSTRSPSTSVTWSPQKSPKGAAHRPSFSWLRLAQNSPKAGRSSVSANWSPSPPSTLRINRGGSGTQTSV